MNTLQHRVRTIDEIYFKAPTVLRIVEYQTPKTGFLNKVNVIKLAPVIPLPHPDMTKRVLSQPTILQEVGKFIYKERYPLLLIGVGTIFLIMGIVRYNAEQKEKK